jgi:hypothetical protein
MCFVELLLLLDKQHLLSILVQCCSIVNSVVSADERTNFCKFSLLSDVCSPQAQQVAGWPSGLRRQFKALVFGRGFESHFSHKILFPLGYSFPFLPAVSQHMKKKENY